MQQIKAQNTIISSVDTLLSNSFVGKLAQNINQVRDAFAQILKSDSPKVRAVIQSVLAPYVNMSDREFVKVAQKAVADLFDWAVQTDQNLNREITDILINDGGVGREVVNFVNQLKESNDPLANNEIIRIIEGIPSMRAAKGGVNNVKLNMAENKVYDQNNVIYAFRELRNRLKSDNNPLYDRIVTLAILQSGLSNSPISFTSLIPYEDFERIYNQTLSKLEGLSNLDHFHKLGVFERNNWNNDEITPYLKASLITSKKTGKKYYNPSMKFLPNPVQDAVRKKEIPPILTRSKNNREANFDYIVYTWEKEEDLLTKEEIEQAKFEGIELYKVIKEKKNRMRKAADFSFINKGLFRKVYDNYGTPLEHITKDGDKYFVYKAINAWGDSFRANEFYDVDHKSVIENGFIQVEDVDNNVIISKFLQDPKSYKKSVPTPAAPTASVSRDVQVVARYTNADVKANPNKIYVFGDNTQRKGTGGQAEIRNNPNAMGIATKLAPSMEESAFMNDKDLAKNKSVIDGDIAKIKSTGKVVVFPKDGLGTGLAKLKQKAPKTYAYLKQRLLEEFGFDNDNGTVIASVSGGVEISSNAKGLAAALTNPTELAKSKGNLTQSYPVTFRGKVYKDAEAAYQALKSTATKDEGPNSTYNLMVDIIKAKLQQYPRLVSEITKQGGSAWILASTHQPTKQNSVWETGGKNWFIKALNQAYVSVNGAKEIKPNNLPAIGDNNQNSCG
jgi:hypothetical protein